MNSTLLNMSLAGFIVMTLNLLKRKRQSLAISETKKVFCTFFSLSHLGD